jgi:hypothetical protein
MTTHPTRSGTILFVGKWPDIKAALNQRMKIEGQCPSQDIDQFAPGYEPGISRKAVQS